MGASLFGDAYRDAPLADRMRPRSLDEFFGQAHLIGPGSLLRRAIQGDRLGSIILAGPPGSGKTTLARIIANTTSGRFCSLNAVLSGIPAIRDAIDAARASLDSEGRKTILFVDEVHRWNKAQQDALLPWVENGTVILIGATTENPYFEVNNALVSRSRVFQLKSLGEAELMEVARAALRDEERGYGKWQVEFEENALEHLVFVAGGDARSLLNALELAVETGAEPWPAPPGSTIRISLAVAEESIQKRAVLHDRDGDSHYDIASAFIKSIRGSDPDAALYWAARMVHGGEDPRFIFRRLLISAAEDVGLACPEAIGTVNACAQAYERVGMPEGQYHLAMAVLFLSTAPKSGSLSAYFDALKVVESGRGEVPAHLKSSTKTGMTEGQEYLYPHNYRGNWVAQQYLPESLQGRVFYKPGDQGYEAGIRELVLERRRLVLEKDDAVFSALREALPDILKPQNAESFLILGETDGALSHEILRLCPQGEHIIVAARGVSYEKLSASFEDYSPGQRPRLIAGEGKVIPGELEGAAKAGPISLIAYSLLKKMDAFMPILKDIAAGSQAAGSQAASRQVGQLPASRIIFIERAPSGMGVLPGLLGDGLDEALVEKFSMADRNFYEAMPGTEDELAAIIADIGLEAGESVKIEKSYERKISADEIEHWLSSASSYGKSMARHLNDDELAILRERLKERVSAKTVSWPFTWLFCSSQKEA